MTGLLLAASSGFISPRACCSWACSSCSCSPVCPAAATARGWDRRLVRWSRLVVFVAMGSGILWLLVRTAVFENRVQAALEPRAVLRAVLDTWPGLVWLARHGLLVLLAAFLAMRANVAARRNWIAARGEALALATLALALVSASSHAAAITPGTLWAVAFDATHLVGTGLWVGGLVALALLLGVASREHGADARPYAVLAARRFSRAALIVMLLLMASGALNAIAQVESVAALAGTTHGRLLLAKLVVLVPILVLAAINRTRILPALAEPSVTVGRSAMRRLTVFVGLEAMLALVLIALAAAMTLTTPARHAEPVWPLPFRLSFDVLVDVPATRWRALLGSQLAAAGLVALIASCLVRRQRAPVLAGGLALVAIGAGVGVLPLVVDAYPTTYKRPLPTYHAASIASGMTIYREHCAGCHGATGAGGPLGDLRSPPTSRRHAGEIFWLISHGIPERGMPDFGQPPRRSPALGRDQLHPGARRRRGRDDARTPGGARPRLARRARLHRRGWPAGPECAARPPGTAHGPGGPLHASGVPPAHDGAGAQLRRALRRRRRDHRRADQRLARGDPRARLVATRAVPGGHRRQRRHRRDVRDVRAWSPRRDSDRPPGLRARDLERRRRRDAAGQHGPGPGGEVERGEEPAALPRRPRALRWRGYR